MTYPNGWRPGERWLIREDMTNDMEQAVAVAARALRDVELRTHDGWEQACHRMAEVALQAAEPVLAGELIACVSPAGDT